MWMGQVLLLGCHPWGCGHLRLSHPLVQSQHRVLDWSSSMQREGGRGQGQWGDLNPAGSAPVPGMYESRHLPQGCPQT